MLGPAVANLRDDPRLGASEWCFEAQRVPAVRKPVDLA